MSYILSLDAGTTSVRAILFDQAGKLCGLAQKEIHQHYPQSGWVEHDPEEIWSAQLGVAIEVLARAGINSRDIAAIGITNQRETAIIWDRETGEPIYNAIVWQDRRTASHCDQLRAEGYDSFIQERSGLLLDAYFSATKIAWILNNVPDARKKAHDGRLAFGTVDTWLIWKLTNGQLHITDASNASRTLLYNIHNGEWDQSLLELFDIPPGLLPHVRDSSEVYGEVSTSLGLKALLIAGIAGDQQAALFGQLCVQPGQTKNTYGTGCFMLQHTGSVAITSRQRLLTTVAWQFGNQREYALEGSVFVGGAVVQWLRDGLGIVRSAPELDVLAQSVPDSSGVVIVPAFTGLGAPHWDAYARGTIIGLTRDTNAAHIARAALESIAFQSADLLEAMCADTGEQIEQLRVDGGACRSEPLMQFQADVLGIPVVKPAVSETTALGAAYLAGLAAGFWKDRSSLNEQWQVERVFEPKMPQEQAQALRSRWNEALSRAKNWEAH